MRRALAALFVSAALALTACGGDGDNATTPAETGAPGTTAPGGPTGTTGSGEKRPKQRTRPDRPARSDEDLEGVDRAIYHGSRLRCRALPLDVAARRYRAKSAKPQDIARAFAKEMYPAKELQRGAYLGCLDGLPVR